jgi:alanyl-tRNA synthetase
MLTPYFSKLFQDVASNGLTAKAWIDHVVPVIEGKGGGKDVTAQATGSKPQAVQEAIKLATDFASLKLS